MFRILFTILSAIPAFIYSHHLEERPNTISFCREELEASPYHRYPYHDLHVTLEREGIQTIKIFSYGSLMDYGSASQTLSPESMATLKPAIAFGVKRLFNRDVPVKPNSKWGIPNNRHARGMLNLAMSGSQNDLVNGIVFEVNRKDIPGLLYREEGYDLIPVIVSDWDDATKKDTSDCYIAYTFYAPLESSYTSSDIDPRPNYYELSRDASKQYGPVFESLWFSTTYLSDGVTPIRKWEDMVQDHDPATQIR
jgi:hypothetical protein